MNTSEREKYVCFAVIMQSGFPLRVLLQLIGQPFASPLLVWFAAKRVFCGKKCAMRKKSVFYDKTCVLE